MMKTALFPRGVTLIEMMVVVVILGVLAAVAIPFFGDMMLVQRLKSINAQLVTDMQFARTEAVSRNKWMRVAFGSTSGLTCYSLFIANVSDDDPASRAQRCDCTQGPGAACPLGWTEVRTVQVPTSLGVTVKQAGSNPAFAFDNVTGKLSTIPTDTPPAAIPNYHILSSISTTRYLRNAIGLTGRPTVCANGSGLGAEAC